MPFKSNKQRKFFNVPANKEKIGPKVVDEFNQASKGMKLPEVKPPTTKHGFAMKGKHTQI